MLWWVELAAFCVMAFSVAVPLAMLAYGAWMVARENSLKR